MESSVLEELTMIWPVVEWFVLPLRSALVQTAWVVNFYSTTKTKQYSAINAVTMNRNAETSLADNAVEMEASIETAWK